MNTDPFLIHLTVFKSRMGLANIVLPLCSLAHQTTATLLRKIEHVVGDRVQLNVSTPEASRIFVYLIEKNMVGKSPRKRGRYKEYAIIEDDVGHAVKKNGKQVESIGVYWSDIWMCDPRVPSTIGVPTPENVEELLELCYQLKLLTRAKNTITTSGILSKALRDISTPSENPFLLGAEGILLFRQFVSTDGFMLREILRQIGSVAHVSRDQLANEFAVITTRALSELKKRVSITTHRKGRDFLRLIDPEVKKSSRPAGHSSSGPGVTEHRLSPRLEWLTDFNYLTKDGIAKNSFSYVVSKDLESLLANLDYEMQSPEKDWVNTVTINEWLYRDCWSQCRSKVGRFSGVECIFQAYALIRRSIGPSPIPDIAFLACLLSTEAIPFENMADDVIALAQKHTKVALTGGRYSRKPESIYIPDELLPKEK